jgi:hypothetical protein
VRTTFDPKRMDFTKRAHTAAQTQFYPDMFPGRPIRYADTVATVRDLDYAIDCQLAVTVPDLRAPLHFAVQERWRQPQWENHGDVTVTEWNLASGQPSELHKLGAHLFVYGFYDAPADRIRLAVAVAVPILLRELACGDPPLRYRRGTRGGRDQTFLGFQCRDLESAGAVMFKLDRRSPEETP